MNENRAKNPVLTNVSNRHIHLSKEDMETLFGKGHTLTKTKDLVQPGEHACDETVTIALFICFASIILLASINPSTLVEHAEYIPTSGIPISSEA